MGRLEAGWVAEGERARGVEQGWGEAERGGRRVEGRRRGRVEHGREGRDGGRGVHGVRVRAGARVRVWNGVRVRARARGGRAYGGTAATANVLAEEEGTRGRCACQCTERRG